MPDKTLTKDQLSQLDSNIRKMVADGLGENDINAYARDFKEKFGTPSKPEPILRQGYAPTKGLPSFEEQQEVLQQVNRFSDSINKDKKKTGSYMGAIFDSFVSAVDPINYIADDVVMKSYEYLSGKKMTPEAKAIARVGTEAIRQTAPLAGLPKTQEKEYVSELQSGWDMSEGFGTKDLKALGVMGSRVLGDLALAASAQAVGVPIGSTYFIQGYGSGLEDYDNMVVNRKVNEDQKTRQFYGLTLGVVNGLLEKFAFDKIFGSGPAYNSIKNKIVSNIFKETAKSTGKLTVDAVENTAKDLVRKELSSIGKRGVRALYGAGVEAVTESSQTALEEATKLISNKIQGEEVFDEKEIKDKFLMNLLNSFVGGFALGGPMGVTSTFMNDVNLKVIDEIAKANTDQQLNSVIADLEQAMVDSKASDEEIELMKNNVVRYNNIKRSIPENVRPEAKSKIIELIDRREGLDAKVGEWKNQLEQVDESMKPDVENELNNLVDARDMINDEIRENAAGGKFSYTEQDGKYFKSFNNESPVEITKSRYELQKTKENATTESKEPVQEGPATGGVSEYQGAEEVQPTKTPIEEAAPKADTGDSVVSGTQDEVIQKTKQSELDVVRERINKINAARDRGELLEDSYPGELKELKKKEKKLSKLDTGEKGIVSEGTVKEFPPEIQDIITEEKQIIDNILNMYSDDAGVVDIYKRMLSRLEENPQEYFKNELSRYSNVTELDGSLSLPQQVSRYKNIVEQFNRRTLPIEQRAEARPTARPSTITPVITTKPKIGRVTSGNVDTVTDLGTNKIQKKVLNDVKRVFNALKSFIPETVGRYTTINLHDQESFKNAVIEAGGKEQDSSSRGFYMASDGSIHLNMDNLASDTMLHEGFHPILDFIEQTNPEKINEFFGQLEAIPEASEIISQARQNYDGDVTQKKEAITDFVAGVADGRIVLNPTNFQKIKAFIQNLLNNIGIGQEQVLMNVKNQSDLVKLAKFVTEKFDTGSEVKADEIGSLIFGDRKYDSSDGVDVNEELPTTGDNRGPQFSKDTIEAAKENLKSPEQLAGTKISRVVFYDLTRVGKLSIKNIKTGYTPDIDGKGGPFYSYMKNSIANKAVLAFTSINQAIQSLQRQIRFPDGVHAVASQNPQTAHLGNKSTLAALFGDGIGIFQDAAKNKAQETEIVNVLKSEIDRISKMPGGEAAKAVKKILKKVDLKSIKTINDFRDKILLGEGDSFGSRGSIFAEILQGKQTKITAATRQSHKILHYKYGIPTIADIAQGNNQQELSSAELGDVIKLVKPSTEPVIYTNDKTLFDKYTANPTPQMKKSGIRIELIPEEAGHESYPFVLAGENVALLDNFISAAKLFKRFENLPKKKSFFSVGRMKKEAEAGVIPSKVTKEAGAPAIQTQRVPKRAISQKPIVGVIKKNFKDAFNAFGLLGKDVKILQDKMSGELSAEMIKAERLAKKSMSLVKKYEKSVPISVVEDFMTGKTPASNLPSDLANAINEARAHIDILTDRLIQLGAIPQESIDNYKNNRGKYLLRSYESINFTDSKLAKFLYGEGLNVDNVYKKLKNVDKSVVDAAIKYLADRARKNNAKLTEEEAIEIAKKDVNEILSDSESYVMQKGLTGSVNVNSLSQRKDIAPEIRALMGEYTDPIYNYYSTIYKIAGLTSSRAYLNDLRTAGLGNFLFEKNDPNRPKEASEVIAAKYTETLAPLNNLYTFPELAEALKKSEKETTNILQQMAGRIRAFKTVYNPATHVKNVIGNMGFAVSNGHWNYAPETFGYIKQMISGKKTKELLNLMDILNRNGVLNSSVGLGEIKSYFDRHADLQSFQKYIYNNATKQKTRKKTSLYKKGKKISGNLAKIPRAIEKAYGLEDDMFKILGFVNESNRYAKIIYKKNYFDLTAKEKADIDEISSEIVKDTYPTFSRVPKIVRGLSKVLFIGNFLSFPAESVRVSYNTLKLAMKEIKSGNKEMARVGMTRLIGTGIYNSLFSTLVYSGYNLAGAGLTGLLGFFSDEEEEKKNKDAINKFLAPWNKKSDIYIGKFSDGKLIYWDIGSLDSYNYQKQVWNAFWNNINNDKGFVESISKAIATGLDPWIEMDFVYDNMIKIINNNDDYGNKIYNPEKGYASKTIDIGKFATKQFAPGAIGAAIKMYEYYDRGDADKLKNEINSQFGARMYTVDLKKSFQSYIYTEPGNAVSREVGFKKRLDDARSIYTDAKRKGVDGAELDAEYARAIEAYKSVLMDTRSYYEAAIRGGVNAYELNMMLNKARLGDRRRDVELLSVMLNKYDYPDMYYIQK